MGDPAGIGSEIVVKALARPEVHDACIPIVIGDKISLEHAMEYCGISLRLQRVSNSKECKGQPGVVEYLDPALSWKK